MTVGDLADLPVGADPDSSGKTVGWRRAQLANANAPATQIKFQRMALPLAGGLAGFEQKVGGGKDDFDVVPDQSARPARPQFYASHTMPQDY